MSKIQKVIRNQRFAVKPDAEVYLVINTKFGDQLKLKVDNCSANGLRTKIDKLPSTEWAVVTDIVPSAKLVWGEKEFGLGRLVIRRFNDQVSPIEVAFSTVDQTVPVEGALSKAVKIDLDSAEQFQQQELSSDKFTVAHFMENDFQSVDLFERIRQFSIFYRTWERSQKFAYHNVRFESKGERINLKRTRKGGRSDYLVMGSNDYLGLGAHPEVVEAAKKALDLYGFGSTGSPVTTGTTYLHTELCSKVAKLHNKEAAILFNSGYTANIGLISCITGSTDLIVADQLCHASIQDGMQMSKATSRFFKHNNVEHLEQVLKAERDNYNGCLVITEGVFSMDGDTAKLDEIFAVARKYNARIMVDQAHCFGVVGPNGLGICEKYDLLQDVDIIMGTFSKIGGGIGGFITGSHDLINWIFSFSRARIFSVSLPPSTVAAVSKALDIFVSEPSHLQNLKRNIQHFVKGLMALGFNVNPNHESAVVPVAIGDESKMGEMYQSLLEDGVLCIPIVYPAVSRKDCRFRFTVMATHSISDLDFALACLEKAMLKASFKVQEKPKGKAA